MGIALIVLGLFLWFSLAFNGGVGKPFVNYSFIASALFMVIAGSMKFAKFNHGVTRIFCAAAFLGYLPMIWQRFNFDFGINWVGFSFDIAIVVFLLIAISSKSNKAPQPTQKPHG